VQPIAAINPYNSFTIRAQVKNKGAKRTFSRNGRENSVFSLELVDEQVGSGLRPSTRPHAWTRLSQGSSKCGRMPAFLKP
jgi:ssDNA-binding replication factor A large subunit